VHKYYLEKQRAVGLHGKSILDGKFKYLRMVVSVEFLLPRSRNLVSSRLLSQDVNF
jgi:hypothetical protein